MKKLRYLLFCFVVLGLDCRPGSAASGVQEPAVTLPPGVRAVWELDKAYREATPTRERVCLNGLWRWQPATPNVEQVPAADWGWFKVPGCWPGITDYMQKDSQTLYAHPAWKKTKMSEVTSAWYQREFTVPASWNGRRILIEVEYLNSFASVWVDGRKAGDLRFPGGAIDLTALCRPGSRHVLSLAVTAMPLKGVILSYSDTFGAKQVRGSVERRGLCGDVYLASEPSRTRITHVQVLTSVRKWNIEIQAGLEGLDSTAEYLMHAQVSDHGTVVKEFLSKPFKAADLKNGRLSFAADWKPEKLWDTVTPQNQFDTSVSLLDGQKNRLDAALPRRFGFREFWIDGRDFYLNGTRIFLCAVPLDNAQIGAASATYESTRESLQRLKSFGVNFVYTHNYGCEPGTHLSFTEVLRAADDEGMLVSFSQPHFGQYDWKATDADQNNGYERHAEFYVRAALNHPSVVCYSMSHNATGTEEEMNPDMIDGIQDARNRWSANGARLALRAEAIVKQLDPSRIVYHHSSGNLGSMHTANFYANFAPIQEMSDWFQHWATVGVKPVFLCEYGVPISWDWMMYRGWYKGVRTFGSARVPWELCMAEWNAQFLGDRAYQITDVEKDCLRWEAKKFRNGEPWYRWDYPRNAVESPDLDERNEIFAMYLTDNLRAFRTWGVSAFCPWDHGIFWKLREGASRGRKDLKVDWDALQRPGLSPDYVDDQMAWMNTAYERSDWVPTKAAQALYRNNGPLLAWIAGKPSAFTSKDHNFLSGEQFEKQLVLINNSRKTVAADCTWSLEMPKPVSGSKQMRIETGTQERIPLTFLIPPETKPGRYELKATVRFSDAEAQEDQFIIDVLPVRSPAAMPAKIALFDPKGETGELLKHLGIPCRNVQAADDLSHDDLLIIGKGALDSGSPAPDITRVREGFKVVLFEQTSEALEQRLGFRVEEYGLRRVFKRVSDHPLLDGIAEENLKDWRGSATLLPSKLNYEIGDRHAPEVKWCGIPVTRLWRAGNRGNVASVLIEKPACGDFLPIVDGGFGLEFSPLLEYREGKGMLLFCQLDATGRTETDPAAEKLVKNILSYAQAWKLSPRRRVVYAGDEAEAKELKRAGVAFARYAHEKLTPDDVLVAGPGAGKVIGPDANTIGEFAKAGGNILAIALDQSEANAFLPMQIATTQAEYINTFFSPFGLSSPLRGLSPADVYNRDPRRIPLIASGAARVGSGVLAQGKGGNLVFCQLAPEWYAGSEQENLRRTYRRVSVLTNRLLANLGAAGSTPLLERFRQPSKANERRWLSGFYMDTPQEWDDPYRFFCW